MGQVTKSPATGGCSLKVKLPATGDKGVWGLHPHPELGKFYDFSIKRMLFSII